MTAENPTTVNKVLRGGSWFDTLRSCRSAFRYYAPAANALNVVGFRIVCTLVNTPMDPYRSESLSELTAITMRPIPAGSFLMGSPEDEPNRSTDEGPQHLVELEAFEISATTITQAQWSAVADLPAVNRTLVQQPSRFTGLNQPVECVNWHEALEFCARLSAYTGREYILPTEAQWEYACRAGTTKPYNLGLVGTDKITTTDANFDGKGTVKVASFPSNNWGLHDMHGNVWEWCLDDWHENYVNAPLDGTAWAGTSKTKVMRGGSWNYFPRSCRSACRLNVHPDYRFNSLGFRVCCLPKDLKPQNANQQLTELALTMLSTVEKSRVFIPEITGTIRKALLLNTWLTTAG